MSGPQHGSGSTQPPPATPHARSEGAIYRCPEQHLPGIILTAGRWLISGATALPAGRRAGSVTPWHTQPWEPLLLPAAGLRSLHNSPEPPAGLPAVLSGEALPALPGPQPLLCSQFKRHWFKTRTPLRGEMLPLRLRQAGEGSWTQARQSRPPGVLLPPSDTEVPASGPLKKLCSAPSLPCCVCQLQSGGCTTCLECVLERILRLRLGPRVGGRGLGPVSPSWTGRCV